MKLFELSTRVSALLFLRLASIFHLRSTYLVFNEYSRECVEGVRTFERDLFILRSPAYVSPKILAFTRISRMQRRVPLALIRWNLNYTRARFQSMA